MPSADRPNVSSGRVQYTIIIDTKEHFRYDGFRDLVLGRL
jgi:hypothetical protein